MTQESIQNPLELKQMHGETNKKVTSATKEVAVPRSSLFDVSSEVEGESDKMPEKAVLTKEHIVIEEENKHADD